MGIAVRGACGGVPASIFVDPLVNHSALSTSFVLSHNIPRRSVSVNGAYHFEVDSPVCVPSCGGWYITTTVIAVQYMPTFDIVLGQDWLQHTGARLCAGVVLDPQRLPSRCWQPSPVSGPSFSLPHTFGLTLPL